MTARHRDDAGFTLVEVLVVMIIFLIILGATLTTFTAFERDAKRSQDLSENVEDSRRTLDDLSRQLRNLAKRYFKSELVIARATPNDIIFQTSDPTKKWVRYCLDTTSSGTAEGGVLWQGQSAGVMPAWMTAASCNGASWPAGNGRATSTLIVNDFPAPYAQPIFTYRCGDDKPATCPAGTADHGSIRSVSAQLLVDQNVNRAPAALRVATSVFLRNQNEPPTLTAFSYRLLPSTHQVILNGSAAADPEGRTLRFFWFVGTAPAFTCDNPPDASTILSRNVTHTHTFTGTTSVSFSLVVCDPGDLQAVAPPQTIGAV